MKAVTRAEKKVTRPSFTVVEEKVEQFMERVSAYPELRYMGSKRRLLPWIHQVLRGLEFETALDPFAGSGCVAYLLKCMGKRVVASDFLNFSATLARATIENKSHRIGGADLKMLLGPAPDAGDFIARTYQGIFYGPADLIFLDRVSASIRRLDHPHKQAVAMSALFRACLKRQPRGVFTVSGDLRKYDDGRRDLRMPLEEHFIEQLGAFNRVVFDNGHRNRAYKADVFETQSEVMDLVYLDPPYVPRADDNCHISAITS